MNRRKFIIASLSGLAFITAAITTRFWGKSRTEQTVVYKPSLNADNAALSTEAHHYFSAHQYALIATLTSHIVPSDDTPGAAEANVVDFIDQQVAKSPVKQKIYSRGLKKLDEYSQNNNGRDFLSLSDVQQHKILDDTFSSSDRRRQEFDGISGRIKRKLYRLWDNTFSVGRLVSMIRTLRRDTLEGFYSHPLGWKVVGYYGPPQLLGYPDYSNAPDVAAHQNELRSRRHLQNDLQFNNQPTIRKT